MSEQLAILVGDKTFSYKDDNGQKKELIISKPKWKEISVFAGIIEGFVSNYHESENDEVFLTGILNDGAKEIRESIEKVLGLCLRKNAFMESTQAPDLQSGVLLTEQNKLADFLAELDYDVVFSLLFIIIEMNKNFFKQNLKKVGVIASKESSQDGEK